MNIQIISKIGDLIIWNHRDLKNKFSNKEIINFFVESWIDRDYIYSFVLESKTPKAWLNAFLKDLYDNWKLDETLKNIWEVISFYNENFDKLINECFKKEVLEIQNNNVAVFMKFGWEQDIIFDEIIKPTCELYWLIVKRADLDTKSADNIHDTIKDMLDNSWLYIVDITWWSPNTFIELWYLLWKEKNKLVIMKQEWETRPFNINDLKMMDYPKPSMDTKKTDKIKENMKDELKRFIDEIKKP